MNIDDSATQQEEFMRDIAMQYRKPELPKTGFCYECLATVKPNANYCDEFCRETHQRRAENMKGK